MKLKVINNKRILIKKNSFLQFLNIPADGLIVDATCFSSISLYIIYAIRPSIYSYIRRQDLFKSRP